MKTPAKGGERSQQPDATADGYQSQRENYEPADDPAPPLYSDDAIGLRFSLRYKDHLRYTAALGKWSVWTGQRWRRDDTLEVPDMTRGICRESSATCSDEKLAIKVASSGGVYAVERLARADRRHAMRVEDWDSDPLLFNTPTGTVDLRTGELKPHKRADHITKITRVAPGGDCPRWVEFLNRITSGDPGLQEFLHRIVGYCLTGVTLEHAIFFLYGTGANGKSVFLSVISHILNDYATVAAMDTFMATNSDRHPTDVAQLNGARLVTASKTEDGRRWDESKLKLLTGGDEISARFMRQDFFRFKPQFKLVVAGNHKPSIRNVDEAMRRRIHLIPFTVTIPPKERDRHLTEKLIAEGPGILAWAIAGCMDWLEQGLNPPESVKSATNEYLSSEDVLGRWMDENTVLQAGHFSSSSSLYDDWKRWCDANREYVGSQKQFSQKLEQRGELTKTRKEEARGFQGIALKSDMAPSAVR